MFPVTSGDGFGNEALLQWLVAALEWFLEHYHSEVSLPATLVKPQ